jgi:2-polyprenyl-3-methyl-5-hydroxy-6-metoxy-1,4-benzoquinol methylase
MIKYVSPYTKKPLSEENTSLKSEDGEIFPIVSGIPRFVAKDNYANAFGLQWETYSKLQLDSFNHTNQSKIRLERCLGNSVISLENKNVLEVGCGAGRFTELLLEGGAILHSVDLSNAVEANKKNIGTHPNHFLAQADVYNLPFPKESFDTVICLGVIQHTPSSKKTIQALWEMVKPGGFLVIDHYKWRLAFYSTTGPYFRLILKRLPPKISLTINNFLVNLFFPLHWFFRNRPWAMWVIRHISPVLENIKEYEQKGKPFNLELAKLETYDHLTDYFKHLLSKKELEKIIKNLPGAENLWIELGGNGIEARCKKAN